MHDPTHGQSTFEMFPGLNKHFLRHGELPRCRLTVGDYLYMPKESYLSVVSLPGHAETRLRVLEHDRLGGRTVDVVFLRRPNYEWVAPDPTQHPDTFLYYGTFVIVFREGARRYVDRELPKVEDANP